jgi:preprotein translocase subunit YajC
VHPTIALVAQDSGSTLTAILPLVLLVGVFYFLLIRPQQRRARAQRELVMSLEVGDEVVTIGGMFGTITAVDDESVTVEVAPGTSMRFVKSAIARKLVRDEDLEEEAGEDS